MPRPSIVQVTVVLLVALVGTMAIAAVQRVRQRRAGEATAAPVATRDGAAARAAATAPPLESTITVPDARPARPAPKPEPTFSVARVKPGRTLALRTRPGGSVAASVGATTEFGSRTTLAVAARRGRWLGMTSTDLPNGKLGWVRASDRSLRTHATHIALRIDLSRRRLELRDGRKVLRHATVGIGRPGSPTPTGRFSITDKLAGTAYGSYYGCCILALSGHQTNTPAGWQGGDRLAIHGTNNPASIGVPSSAGCLHADAEDLKVLMRKVPLGTPVFIRA